MSSELRFLKFHDFLEGSVTEIIKRIGVPETVIEIGVYTGYFTFNMTGSTCTVNKNYKHYCIDPFDESHDLEADKIKEAYEDFKYNLSVFEHSNHIEFIRKKSVDGLLELLSRGVKADLIYIDGDHMASTVLNDLVLSFQLLKLGGAILCDDSVTWAHTEKNNVKPVDYSPKLAVDAFIHCNWSIIEPVILPNGYQTAFIKRG